MEPAMLTKYKEQVSPALMEKFQYANVHQIPQIVKIAINSGFGDMQRMRRAFQRRYGVNVSEYLSTFPASG